MDTLLPFCDELGIRELIDVADRLVTQRVAYNDFDDRFEVYPYFAHRNINAFLKALALTHQYNLKRSEPVILKSIEECWSRSPSVFWDNSNQLFKILADNDAFCDRLWHFIQPYIPRRLKKLSRRGILLSRHLPRSYYKKQKGAK